MTQAVDRLVTEAVDCVDLSYQFATHLAVDHAVRPDRSSLHTGRYRVRC
jgi:hypothetical protein